LIDLFIYLFIYWKLVNATDVFPQVWFTAIQKLVVFCFVCCRLNVHCVENLRHYHALFIYGATNSSWAYRHWPCGGSNGVIKSLLGYCSHRLFVQIVCCKTTELLHQKRLLHNCHERCHF